MFLSELGYELAQPKEWDEPELTNSERAEVEAMAEEIGCTFEEAFEVWLEQVNKSNADAWEWQL